MPVQISPHLYKILDLENFASKEAILKQYRKLALVHHPDKGGDLQKMQQINAAKEFLIKHKDEYDRKLKIAMSPPAVVVHYYYTWAGGGGTSSTTSGY